MYIVDIKTESLCIYLIPLLHLLYKFITAIMSELNKENKDIGSIEAVFKESSPRTHKKEKTKYQAFRSDDSLSSENEESGEPVNR